MNDSEQRRLAPAFSELTDAVTDLRSANGASLGSVLRRLVALVDKNPLAEFIAIALPTADFDAWWARMRAGGGAMAGSGSLEWPQERAARVAMQLALCRALADERIAFHELALHFLYVATPNISAHVQRFVQVVAAPMVRDLMRLAETRVVSLPLSTLGALPRSGDDMLDQLLREAMSFFRDTAPAARQQAAERLWDAWERLKTLDEPGDKRRSTEGLLLAAADSSNFRDLLQNEARTLTDIGNQFHIRHFETDRDPITRPEHYDYLFHRLWALIELLLHARVRLG